MTEKEIDKIFDKLDDVWGDWESMFKVMNENNLKVVGSEIQTSEGNHVDSLCSYFYGKTVDLFGVAYEYYKKAHSSSNIQMGKSTEKAKVSEPEISKKSKYMKLC